MVEDRARPLGRLRIGDRGADNGCEDGIAETFLQRGERLARVHGADVGEVQKDADQGELRVEAVARKLEHLNRLLDALQCEVLGLGGDQRMVRGDKRVDRQQAQRRRAVDQDDLVVPTGLRERSLERHLAAHLAAQHQLRLGKAQVGGDDVLVDRLSGLRAAREHIGDRRLHVGRQVEVVGEVALRIEVNRQRAHAATTQDVGQRADRRGLPGAPLL